MPEGIPNDRFGKCDRCGRQFQLHGIKQKRCDACRIPARLELANAKSKLYYRENKDRIRVRKRVTEAKRLDFYREMRRRNQSKRRIQARRLVIGHYSQGTYRCACCGESQYDFLELDHINGGGGRENLQLFGGRSVSSALFCWLVTNGFPPGYQILCANCNRSKGKHGTCVHRRPTTQEKTLALDHWVRVTEEAAGEPHKNILDSFNESR